jgi:Protein of unknown function (DUF3662)/FHA domain
MGLARFEKRLERAVEGAFARAFRSQVRPVELGRRIAREMDLSLDVGVKGQRVAPNFFTVLLSVDDVERLAQFATPLAVELADAAEEHALDEGYTLRGPAEVELIEDPDLHTGQFDVQAAIRPGARSARATAWLTAADGTRVALTAADTLTIGRQSDCDIVVNDTNVSRHHAEIRVEDGTAVLVDLGSLNGTRVNGKGVPPKSTVALSPNDEIWVGTGRITFSVEREGAAPKR